MEKTKISLIPNGPMVVEGEFLVNDKNGNPVETKEKAYLCRCGASVNKPFCDGSHKKIEFKD